MHHDSHVALCLTGTSRAKLREMYNELGDMGDVAQACRHTQASTCCPPTTHASPPMPCDAVTACAWCSRTLTAAKGCLQGITQSLPRCLCRAGTNILSTLKFKFYCCYPALRCDILYCGVSSTYLLHVIAMYCGQIVAWFGIDWHYAGHYKINVAG